MYETKPSDRPARLTGKEISIRFSMSLQEAEHHGSDRRTQANACNRSCPNSVRNGPPGRHRRRGTCPRMITRKMNKSDRRRNGSRVRRALGGGHQPAAGVREGEAVVVVVPPQRNVRPSTSPRLQSPNPSRTRRRKFYLCYPHP